MPLSANVLQITHSFFMPGLADIHMHIVSINRTFEGFDQLLLHLAQGVTAIRNLGAQPEHLA